MLMNYARRIGATTLMIGTLSLTLAACGGDDGDHDTSSMGSQTQKADNGDVYSQADVDFATNMIPHHAQAIAMVTMTEGRTLDAEVQELADEIRDAQAPEVERMSGWLRAWGEQVPKTPLDHASAGHDMSEMPEMPEMKGMDMPGMMTADEMQGLEDASDEKFQDMWLEMMVRHHEGAIEMAQREQESGNFSEAVDLAESIETSQQAEIKKINELLSQ